MKREFLLTVLRSDYLKLVPILGLAFYMAFIPHMDSTLPVHLDEWIHMANAGALIDSNDVTASLPFSTYGAPGDVTNLEAGYQLLLAVFHQVSGLSWITIIRYLPPVIFLFAVLAAYAIGRRKGFGLEAALMTCLITTTVGIMGPGFLVPVALDLPFIALGLYIAYNFRSFWGYLSLLLVVSFLLSMHAPGAIGLGILLVPLILLSLRNEYRHGIGLIVSLGLPLLPAFLVVDTDLIADNLNSLFKKNDALDTHVQWPVLIRDYGYIPVACCVLGVIALMKKGGREAWSLAGGLILLLIVLISYSRFQYGMVLFYNRSLLFTMLTMGIVAGFGLSIIKPLTIPERIRERLRIPRVVAEHTGALACLGIIVAIFAIAIPERNDTPYYHMIDKYDYQAFQWIEKNLGQEYDRAILDPWKGVPFTAVTGKRSFSNTRAGADVRSEEVWRFLGGSCKDTEFLKENDISIVYTRRGCDNPELELVNEYTYVLK